MRRQRTTERHVRRGFAVVGLPVALVILAAGCSSDDKSSSSTASTAVTSSVSVLPPTIVDLSTVGGTTVAVRLGGTIDMNSDATVTDWTAEIADPAIVSFTPGRTDGSATFNPGLVGMAPGSTEVTMTNSSSGETTTFTVTVG